MYITPNRASRREMSEVQHHLHSRIIFPLNLIVIELFAARVPAHVNELLGRVCLNKEESPFPAAFRDIAETCISQDAIFFIEIIYSSFDNILLYFIVWSQMCMSFINDNKMAGNRLCV